MKPSFAGMGSLAKDLPESIDSAGDAGSVSCGVAALPRIGVIRNPTSHYNRRSGPDSIDLPHVLRIVPKGRPEMARALRDFAGKAIDLLVIDGGDGTVRDVLTEGAPIFGRNWPKLLVLPSGKTNALALDLGVPKRLRLAEALQGIERAHVVGRRPIRVERRNGGKPVLGFLLGAGVFNAAIDTGQVAHRFGAFQSVAVGVTAAAAILQALLGIGDSPWRRTVPMRIALGKADAGLDHSRHGEEGRRYGLGISTLENFPLGMRPFGRHAGGLKFIAWDKPLRRLIALTPFILMGLDAAFLKRWGVFRGAEQEIRLSLEGRFILDGESYEGGELRILPGHEVQFLVP